MLLKALSLSKTLVTGGLHSSSNADAPLYYILSINIQERETQWKYFCWACTPLGSCCRNCLGVSGSKLHSVLAHNNQTTKQTKSSVEDRNKENHQEQQKAAWHMEDLYEPRAIIDGNVSAAESPEANGKHRCSDSTATG